ILGPTAAPICRNRCPIWRARRSVDALISGPVRLGNKMTMVSQQARTIFLDAVELTSAQLRRDLVAAKRAAAAALQREVEELLQHHDGLAASFLESPSACRVSTVEPSPCDRPG